jgi:hypothetical protein
MDSRRYASAAAETTIAPDIAVAGRDSDRTGRT